MKVLEEIEKIRWEYKQITTSEWIYANPMDPSDYGVLRLTFLNSTLGVINDVVDKLSQIVTFDKERDVHIRSRCFVSKGKSIEKDDGIYLTDKDQIYLNSEPIENHLFENQKYDENEHKRIEQLRIDDYQKFLSELKEILREEWIELKEKKDVIIIYIDVEKKGW
ncbi:MAG: hypothetical protein HZR80_18985 [Candidatus Heimdallarchaeota archaeon]